VPFLGAGASMGFGEIGIPPAGALAQALARECDYRGPDQQDFLRVCQYYELWSDKDLLRKAIIKRLSPRGLMPGLLHRNLATLPVEYVLTTNYDNLIERAFESEAKQPMVAVHDIWAHACAKFDPGTIERPLVYKLHGSMSSPRTMICTEDDVIQLLTGLIQGEPALSALIGGLFPTHSILFIGYGLRDWNVRVMIRAMRAPKVGPDWIRSFAIQRRPDDESLAFDWDRSVVYWDKRENIRCFDVDALEFVAELAARYRSEQDHPDGGR
jgi:SIR2-like domain